MANIFDELAIIVPLAPGETCWKSLVANLHHFNASLKIYLVGTKRPSETLEPPVQWISSPVGRAKQLNTGAARTSEPFLWFLHADSKFSKDFSSLIEKCKQNPDYLYYWDLRFYDGPWMMRLNEFGVWIRSHVLKIPFGDQGFFISRRQWMQLRGFDEQVPYGEDHHFVWKARKAGIPIRASGGVLDTSARKYAARGWLRTTSNHLKLTYQQAAQCALGRGN